MRSSVSVILSDPVPDNTMAFPDYAQTCADHARYFFIFFTRVADPDPKYRIETY
jgi:hypothetical protein